LNRSTNLTALTDSILAETAPAANNLVQNLGANSDIYFGLAANLTDTVSVGLNPGATPWKGISTDSLADRTLNNGSTINASNVLNAGVLDVSIPGFSGTGIIPEQPGGIVAINDAAGLSGTQLTGPGIGNGAVVRMAVDNITNINTVNGAAIFEMYGPSGRTQN